MRRLLAVLAIALCGVTARAEDIKTELTFHTVVGYSLYGNEVLTGELCSFANFRGIVSFQAGYFFSGSKQYPSAGLCVNLKEAVKGLGGAYQWTIPGLEPELGFGGIANTDALLLKTGERIFDVTLYANVFKVKF